MPVIFGFEWSRLFVDEKDRWHRYPVEMTEYEKAVANIFSKVDFLHFKGNRRFESLSLAGLDIRYRYDEESITVFQEFTMNDRQRKIEFTLITTTNNPWSRYLVVSASSQRALDSLLTIITLAV